MMLNLCLLLGLLARHSSAWTISPSINVSPRAAIVTTIQKQQQQLIAASTIVLSAAAVSKEEDLELTIKVITQHIGTDIDGDGSEEDEADEADDDNSYLLNRIGGEPALAAAVDEFYIRVVDDPKLAPYFAGVPMHDLKSHQRNFLRMAFTEIPGDVDIVKYLSTSHDRLWEMGLDETDFDAVAGHLVGAMQALGVEQHLIDEAVAIVVPLRGIFEKTLPKL